MNEFLETEHRRKKVGGLLKCGNGLLVVGKAIEEERRRRRQVGTLERAISNTEVLGEMLNPFQVGLLNQRLSNGYQVHSFGSGGSGSRHTVVRGAPKKQQLKQPRDRLTILIIKICNNRKTTQAHSVWIGLKNEHESGNSIILSCNDDVIEWETKPMNRCRKGKIAQFRKSSLSPKLTSMKREYGHLLRYS